MDDRKEFDEKSTYEKLYDAINTPELKTSLWYTLLLTISVVFQLLSDTYITRIVGQYGESYATARGVTGTITGFAFFVFGFLTNGFTSKVSRVYGSGIKHDLILGAWIKTALLSGLGAGILTLLAFGPTYTLWLRTFGVSRNDSIFELISIWYWTRLLGMTPNLIYNAIMGVLQGMQMPLYIVANNIFLAIVDVLCNYLFLDVFGWGPAGSPMGINIAFIGSLIFALFYLFYGPTIKDSFTIMPLKQMLPMKENKIILMQGGSLMLRSFLIELSSYLVAISSQSFSYGAIVAVTNVNSELSKYSYFIPSGLGTAGIMLGGYLIGKGEFEAFRTLLVLLPIGGILLSFIFFIVLASTGPFYWTNFFFASDDDGFDSVYRYVRILWWLVLLIQPINAMLAVYEGILYATQSFDYVRNCVVVGFMVIFLPLFLIGWLAGKGSITVIILSQTLYSLFLVIAFGYKVHTTLIDEIKEQMSLEKQEEEMMDPKPSSDNVEVSPIHRIEV